jgi:hypothetical protein
MGLFSGLGKLLKAPLNLHKGIIRNAAPGNVKKNTMRLFGGGGGGGATPPGQQAMFMNQGNPMMAGAFQNLMRQNMMDPSMFMRPGAMGFMNRNLGPPGQGAQDMMLRPAVEPGNYRFGPTMPMMMPGGWPMSQWGGKLPSPYGGPASWMMQQYGGQQRQSPGPSPDLSTIMRQYQGLLGNGGGAMMPNAFRSMIDNSNIRPY